MLDKEYCICYYSALPKISKNREKYKVFDANKKHLKKSTTKISTTVKINPCKHADYCNKNFLLYLKNKILYTFRRKKDKLSPAILHNS